MLCFSDGKIVLEESRGTKPESLFHTLCYHNQMDIKCAGKSKTLQYVRRTDVELNQLSRNLSLATKIKPPKIPESFIGVAKW